MAKERNKTATAVAALNVGLLKRIADATELNQPFYVAKEPDVLALVGHNPQLIEVNPSIPDPTDASKAACRVTEAGKVYLASQQAPAGSPQAAVTSQAPQSSAFSILSGVELPKVKRKGGGAGAPVKYPFEAMTIGQSFFVPASDKQPNPAKSLGSTISSANLKYCAVRDGDQTVTRTKRGDGNKAMVGPDGNNVQETVTIPKYKYTAEKGKFTLRPVEGGKTYGGWTAPTNGAIVQRVAVD